MYSARKLERSLSVRMVLALWYTVTIALLALALSLFLYYRLDHDLTRANDRFLKAYMEELSEIVKECAQGKRSLDEIDRELKSFRQLAVEYRVLDETGAPVYSTGGWGGTPLPGGVGNEAGPCGTLTLYSQHYPFRTNAIRIDVGEGRMWLTQIALSLKGEVKAMANYRRNLLLFAIPLVGLATIGGYLLARRSLRPVLAMAGAARAISGEDKTRRLRTDGIGDELDILAEELNAMLDRIEEAFGRIERYSTDLAHELRTPLTQLIGETEAALVGASDPAELKDLLVRHAETYRRMQQLVTDLLGLLRDGTDDHTSRFESANVREIAADVLDRFHVLAEEKGIKLEMRGGGEDSTIHCNPAMLRRALANLIDNAIRHSSPGGSVELRVARGQSSGGKSSVEITVSDHGEGISAEDLPRVFDRFYRSASAIARGGGFGLGLSITRQIVESHGGTIQIASEPGKGTTVVIRLPNPLLSRA